jgi:hypothetical protein
MIQETSELKIRHRDSGLRMLTSSKMDHDSRRDSYVEMEAKNSSRCSQPPTAHPRHLCTRISLVIRGAFLMRGSAFPSLLGSGRRRSHDGFVRTVFFCLTFTKMTDSAQSMIQEAGIQLQTTVTSTEATSFNHTTFDDVEQALHAIEDEQAKRMSLRNLARIEPFLSWMQDYSSVLDTFCQGFSPMTWVWVHRI